MKLAVLSESSADEAAVRILVEGLFGKPVYPIAHPELRARGWPSVRDILPTVLRHLHYHTDAEAFVVVADSDRSVVHRPEHGRPGRGDQNCRLCQLRAVMNQVQSQLRGKSVRPVIKTAIGLAVPSMEAWYRCGVDPHITEANWILSLQQKCFPYTASSLKQDVYGARWSLVLETERAKEEARRLVENLETLEAHFPSGFGSLASDVRSW